MSYCLTPPLQISQGAEPPVPGEALKLRLPGQLSLDIPESLNSQTPISGSVSKQVNYHTVFIKSSNPDIDKREVDLELWVAPAITQPDNKGRFSVDKFLSWPESKREWWIPLPYRPPPDAAEQWAHTGTPPLFGAPLYVGGWENTRPSWLAVSVIKMKLKYTKSFKRFEPPVKLSFRERTQIEVYERAIRAKTTNSASTSPTDHIDDEGNEAGGGGDVFGGNVQARTWASVVEKGSGNLVGKAPTGGQQHTKNADDDDYVDGDDDDDDDDEGDWEEEGDLGDLLGILASYDDKYMEMFMDHRREVRAHQQEGVLNWLHSVY